MKETNETNEKNLNEFLLYCKEQIDFVEIQTYVNSVKVHFEKAILSSVFIRLNLIDYQFFVYNSQISDYNTIVLFIYKKKCYEFN